jgi:endonuclease-3
MPRAAVARTAGAPAASPVCYNASVTAPEARARLVYRRLLESYREPTWRNPLPPLDELLSTVLSQNTNDTNRDRAFERLKAAFDSWEAVRDADPAQVVEAIRPAGLANQKGPRIQAILQTISAEHGSLDLEFLRHMPPDEVRQWLLGFKGVGPKTAAIVMLFSLDLPAFPVDTHVYRVCGRLGLLPEKESVAGAHKSLAALFAPETYRTAHLNLIRHGREVCHARNPGCKVCVLLDICPYGHQRLAATG